MTWKEEEEIVNSYVVSGVPGECISLMFNELKIKDGEMMFMDFMGGKTVSGVGGKALYNKENIMRFIRSLPIMD